MSQSWFVQNHIRTVHAIAICNLIEITMAIVTEASLPSHLRWLPVGMDVNYLKKATGKLEATSTIDPAAHFKLAAYPGEVKIPIEVKNRSGELVTKAEVSSVQLLASFPSVTLFMVFRFLFIICRFVFGYLRSRKGRRKNKLLAFLISYVHSLIVWNSL